MTSIRSIREWTLAVATLLFLAFASGAIAQGDEGRGDVARDRDRTHQNLQDGTSARDQDRDREMRQDGDLDRDRVRDQLRAHIDAAGGLTPDDRAKMHANLDACLALDIPANGLAAVFPGEGEAQRMGAQTMLRLQNRVMTAAREGLAVEPMLAKVQEGRTKHVPDPLVEQACERMETHVRNAQRVMEGAANAGVEVPEDPAQNRRMQGEVAQQMWRGMNAEGYEALRERARDRVRAGECDATDLVSAAEVATRLQESGVERGRAVRFAGDALEHGYRAGEMRQMQIMVAARHRRGEPVDRFLGDMEYCVSAGMGTGEMYGYMIRHGWMGPGDMYGPGGNDAGANKGYGGGHMGDDGNHKGGGGTSGQGGQDDTGNLHGGGKP